MKIAIIGAGIAGLTLAQQLKSYAEITVFEKSRGVGGRMATRTAGEFQFDHGVQHFTARSKPFRAFLQPFLHTNVVQFWKPLLLTLEVGQEPYKRDWFEAHYVGTPVMTSLAKTLAQDIDIRLQTKVTAVSKDHQFWQINTQDAAGTSQLHEHFDWVLYAIPAPQVAKLLPAEFAEQIALDKVSMTPCFSLMLGMQEALKLNFAAAKVQRSAISWISVNSARPQRDTGYSLLVHTDPAWSQAHIEHDPNQLQAELIQTLVQLLNQDIQPTHAALHRWLYAGTSTPLGQDYWLNTDQRIGLCGDWCISERVESAVLSSLRLAEKIKILTRAV